MTISDVMTERAKTAEWGHDSKSHDDEKDYHDKN
jgi:hypothetical protein